VRVIRRFIGGLPSVKVKCSLLSRARAKVSFSGPFCGGYPLFHFPGVGVGPMQRAAPRARGKRPRACFSGDLHLAMPVKRPRLSQEWPRRV